MIVANIKIRNTFNVWEITLSVLLWNINTYLNMKYAEDTSTCYVPIFKYRYTSNLIYIIIILLNLSCSSDCSSEIKKCTGEYLAALKSNKHSSGTNQQYLPRCASDGSYSPTQCHYSIGYCWCVDVDTGKPIPDTTRKSTSLDCWKYSK